jgi:hypothetical protein
MNQESAGEKRNQGGSSGWLVLIGLIGVGVVWGALEKKPETKSPPAANPDSTTYTPSIPSTPVYQPRLEQADEYARERQQRIAQQRQADEFAGQAAGQLMQAAMEDAAARQQAQGAQQEQQYQRFTQQCETASICQACGGSGSYRHVDGYGSVQVKTCPYCNGMGRKW